MRYRVYCDGKVKEMSGYELLNPIEFMIWIIGIEILFCSGYMVFIIIAYRMNKKKMRKLDVELDKIEKKDEKMEQEENIITKVIDNEENNIINKKRGKYYLLKAYSTSIIMIIKNKLSERLGIISTLFLLNNLIMLCLANATKSHISNEKGGLTPLLDDIDMYLIVEKEYTSFCVSILAGFVIFYIIVDMIITFIYIGKRINNPFYSALIMATYNENLIRRIIDGMFQLFFILSILFLAIFLYFIYADLEISSKYFDDFTSNFSIIILFDFLLLISNFHSILYYDGVGSFEYVAKLRKDDINYPAVGFSIFTMFSSVGDYTQNVYQYLCVISGKELFDLLKNDPRISHLKRIYFENLTNNEIICLKRDLFNITTSKDDHKCFKKTRSFDDKFFYDPPFSMNWFSNIGITLKKKGSKYSTKTDINNKDYVHDDVQSKPSYEVTDQQLSFVAKDLNNSCFHKYYQMIELIYIGIIEVPAFIILLVLIVFIIFIIIILNDDEWDGIIPAYKIYHH